LYRDQFDKIYNDWRLIGFNRDAGLLGKIRRAIDGVERRLLDYRELSPDVPMLDIRHLEHNFMRSLDPGRVGELIRATRGFRNVLSDSNLPVDASRAIATGMTAYELGLERLAEIRVRLINDQADLDAAFAILEPLLVALADATSQNLNFAEAKDHELTQKLVRITAAVMLGVVAIVLVLGFLIAGWIGNPIRSMTVAMTGLADGNRDIEIPEVRLGQELSAMGEAMACSRKRQSPASAPRTSCAS
jgi:methyl-accepting chemotaxis protein